MTEIAEDVKMSEEPDFLSQNGELFTREDQLRWFHDKTAEAQAGGAVLARYSIHPDIPGLALFEAWKQRPNDQGDIRWQLTRVAS